LNWEANHVYAPARQLLLETLCANPALDGALYVVDRLDGILMDERDSSAYPLPEAGLLVVRELYSGERRLLRWTENEIASWQALRGPDDLDVITADSIGEDTYISHLYAPPASFLRFLKATSQAAHSPLAFYHLGMFGNATEEEFAWVFGSGEDRLYVRNGDTTVAMHSARGREILNNENVLSLILRHLGVPLEPGATPPFFPLHRMSFPWLRYRLDCASVHWQPPSRSDAS
jgi:hypothetical protein